MLQDSLARELGVLTYDFIRIGSQNTTNDLLTLLVSQKEAGVLSDYDEWFSFS
jgi:hypothetical protein